MKIKSSLILIAICASFFLAFGEVHVAQTSISDTAREDMYVTDGTVRASVLSSDNQTLYIGGDFTHVGPKTGAGGMVEIDSGTLVPQQPFIDGGQMYASVSDGSGGWYIGGTFTAIGSFTRNGIAHILADGSLDEIWNPDADAMVYSLALSGSTLYAGGFFTSIGGESRNYIAALDTTTGLATPWDPQANGYVQSIVVDGSTVYVGGSFSSVGGESRSFIAALDSVTGAATAWAPESDGPIYSMAIDDATIYAGGEFSFIGGESRNSLAAIDLVSGLATAWNPDVQNSLARTSIYSIAVDDSTIYVGGLFSSVGELEHQSVVAIDAVSGLANAWDPGLAAPIIGFPRPGSNITVNAVSVYDSVVYIGGTFKSAGGFTRNNIVAVDASSGVPTDWYPVTSGRVLTLANDGSNIYIGGSFNSIGGKDRNYLAAIDVATGAVTDWDPKIQGNISGPFFSLFSIYTVALRNSTLFVGGNFRVINGESRNNIAAFDTNTGALTSWDPQADDVVYSLAASGTTVYVGGNFHFIGGEERNNLAALDTGFGLANSWNPNVNSAVIALLIKDSLVYIGGQFTEVGGVARNHLAAITTVNGSATNWNPNVNQTVRAISENNSIIYIGGDFTAVGGQTRNHIAALDNNAGLVTFWDPDADNTVYAIQATDSLVYAGGDFVNIGDQGRGYASALNVSDALATDWNPDADSTVYTFAKNDTKLYLGGSFSYAVGSFRGGLASFDLISPSAPSALTATALSPDSIHVTWVDNADDETAFVLQTSTDNSTYVTGETLAPNTTQATLTNLNSETKYWIRVAALNKEAHSTYTESSVTTYAYVNRRLASNNSFGSSGPGIITPPLGETPNAVDTPHGNPPSTSVPINSPTSKPLIPTIIKYIFKRNLFFSVVGVDVKELQKYLNTHGFIVSKIGAGSIGGETNFFGRATRNALIAFQKAKRISPAFGYFGPITRKIINQ